MAYERPFFELTWLPAFTADGTSIRKEAEAQVALHFDANWSKLSRYVTSIGVPRAHVEDILQESFLALFCHILRGGACTNLRAWLFRVAHNLGLKHLQSEQRFRSLVATHNLHLFVTNPIPNPEQQLVQEHRQHRLHSVFQALPEQDQQCLFLRFEGLRYREISEVLGISLGSVANSVARSIQRLERADEI